MGVRRASRAGTSAELCDPTVRPDRNRSALLRIRLKQIIARVGFGTVADVFNVANIDCITAWSASRPRVRIAYAGAVTLIVPVTCALVRLATRKSEGSGAVGTCAGGTRVPRALVAVVAASETAVRLYAVDTDAVVRVRRGIGSTARVLQVAGVRRIGRIPTKHPIGL
jgi:hypothetical protein